MSLLLSFIQHGLVQCATILTYFWRTHWKTSPGCDFIHKHTRTHTRKSEVGSANVYLRVFERHKHSLQMTFQLVQRRTFPPRKENWKVRRKSNEMGNGTSQYVSQPASVCTINHGKPAEWNRLEKYRSVKQRASNCAFRSASGHPQHICVYD